MAYVDPTPAEIKARWPVFAAVPDPVVQAAIDEAKRQVDESWFEGDYTNAVSLYAAHVLTLDGQGTGAGAVIAGQGLQGVSRIKSGVLDVSFADGAGGGGASGSDPLDWSPYGQRFKMLRKQNKGGPRTTGGGAVPLSGYAKDWPWPYRGGW